MFSEKEKTPLEGLFMRETKTFADERGFLAELSFGGSASDIFLEKGIGNMLAAVASTQGVPRGGHYHLTSYENSWTMQGSALWYFRDLDPASSTYKKSAVFLLGEKSVALPEELGILDHTLERRGSIVQMYLSPLIYHLLIPLIAPVVFFETASRPYDEKDYMRIPFEDIDDELLKGIRRHFVQVKSSK